MKTPSTYPAIRQNLCLKKAFLHMYQNKISCIGSIYNEKDHQKMNIDSDSFIFEDFELGKFN